MFAFYKIVKKIKYLMIYYQNSWRILEENSCMLFTGDILDWRYFDWRYIAGDIIYWRYYWLAIFWLAIYCWRYYLLAILLTGDILLGDILLAIYCWRYFFRTPSKPLEFYWIDLNLLCQKHALNAKNSRPVFNILK